MQTQCPHCDTKFRVTEIQVDAADGFVRCGICDQVFNAIEVAATDEYQHSLLVKAQTEADPETLTEAEAHFSSSEEEPIVTVETDEDIVIQPNVLEEHEVIDFDNASATDTSRKDAFDFFDEETNESLTHVVPDKYRDNYSSSVNNTLSTALWSLGALLLTATLMLEYVWFNRNNLNQVPQIQSVIEKLCLQMECKDLMMRHPAKIELVTRNVYSHPNTKKALLVNVTMKNTATFAQPYPVMQIDFSDIRGTIVAARRFYPNDYTDITAQQGSASTLLQPDIDTTVTLEISDPGKQAMTYEFNFL